MVCADPESVVIRGPGHWRSLMTGLWPVLAFVCLECSSPQQVSAQLALPAGPWPPVWVGKTAGPGATAGSVPAGAQSSVFSTPLLSFLNRLHSGTRSGCWRRLHLLAPPGSTAPCHYLSHSQSSASFQTEEPPFFYHSFLLLYQVIQPLK